MNALFVKDQATLGRHYSSYTCRHEPAGENHTPRMPLSHRPAQTMLDRNRSPGVRITFSMCTSYTEYGCNVAQ